MTSLSAKTFGLSERGEIKNLASGQIYSCLGLTT